MKKFAPVITLILLASCAHHQKDQHVAGVRTPHRSIAQVLRCGPQIFIIGPKLW